MRVYYNFVVVKIYYFSEYVLYNFFSKVTTYIHIRDVT